MRKNRAGSNFFAGSFLVTKSGHVYAFPRGKKLRMLRIKYETGALVLVKLAFGMEIAHSSRCNRLKSTKTEKRELSLTKLLLTRGSAKAAQRVAPFEWNFPFIVPSYMLYVTVPWTSGIWPERVYARQA